MPMTRLTNLGWTLDLIRTKKKKWGMIRRKRRQPVVPGGDVPERPRKRTKTLPFIETIRAIDERTTLATAVARGYPFAEETSEIHALLRTADFLLYYSDLLLQAPRRRGAQCVIRPDATLAQRNGGARGCDLLSMNNLQAAATTGRRRRRHAVPPPFFATSTILEKTAAAEDLSPDVYVCTVHRGLMHVCDRRCMHFTEGHVQQVCPISLRQRELLRRDEFETVNVKGAKVSVRKQVIGMKRRRELPSSVSFRFDGRRVPMDVPAIKQRYAKVAGSIINVRAARGFCSAQLRLYATLIRRGATRLEKVRTKIHEAPRRRKKKKKKKKKKKAGAAAEEEVRVPRRRKTAKRRRSRRHITGQFDKSSTEKMFVSIATQTHDTFRQKKRAFIRAVRAAIHYSSVHVVTYTHVAHALRALDEEEEEEEEEGEGDRPGTAESFFVDPYPCQWFMPYAPETVCTRVRQPVSFYMQFLLNADVQRVIRMDLNREFSLRSDVQPRLLDAPEDSVFLEKLPEYIHVIRQVTPGLFRLIMMLDEIRKECSDNYNDVKTLMQNRHKRGRAVSEEDVWQFLREVDYKKLYLHATCSDNFLLETAEVLYWAETTCFGHPAFLAKNSGQTADISHEMVFVGTLYHMKKGLHRDGVPLIPRDVTLCRRNVLVPQNSLGLFKIDRQDVTKGMQFVKDILFNLCEIRPIEEVAFPFWKMRNSVLVPLEEFGKESLVGVKESD